MRAGVQVIRASALISILALTGCATVKPHLPVIPKIISVPVVQYVPIPDELTAACHRTERTSNHVVDVVDAYNKRGDDIDECNKRMAAIRRMGH
jgi:hypothetical protein